MIGSEAEIKLEEGGGKGREGRVVGEGRNVGEHAGLDVDHIPAAKFRKNAEHPGDEDADQDGALDAEVMQHGKNDEADQSEGDSGGLEVAKAHESISAGGNDNAGALAADQRDEQADAGGDGVLEVLRDAVDNLLTELERGEDDEDEALDQNGGQSDSPGIVAETHAKADRVGEVGVQAHAGSQSHRVVREEAHDEGCEGGGESRGHKDRVLVHTRCREHARVHREDVGHREEGRDAGDDFGFDVGSMARKIEEVLLRRGRTFLVSCHVFHSSCNMKIK